MISLFLVLSSLGFAGKEEPVCAEITKNVVKGYTQMAATYEATLKSTYMVSPKEIDKFFRSLEPKSRILDAGCGPGVESEVGLRFGHEMVGLDITPKMIERYMAAMPGSKAAVGSIAALPFEDEAFDGVLMASSLLHVDNKTGRQALNESSRVLRKEGKMLLATMVGSGVGEFHSREALAKAGVESLYFYYWERAKLKEALSDAGFAITSWSEKELVQGRPAWVFIELIKRR